MRKNSIFLSTIMVIILILAACSSNNESSPDSESSSQGENTTLPTEDRAGHEIVVPKNIETIVSLAPSITQVIEDLGEKDKLVAVDSASPTYVEGIDDLAQVDISSPDMETLLALEPDVVFASGLIFSGSENPFQVLTDAGICVIQIPTSESLGAMKEDIQFIADSLNRSEEGTAIVSEMQREIDKISAIGDSVTKQKTVLFEISALPDIYSFGSGVFLNEMIEIIGAKNVLADQIGWLPVTEEAAVGANPDVILTNVNYIENPVEEILSRSGWQSVTAVENKAVAYIDNGSSSIPNHHIVKALREIAKAVYPEAYATIEE